LPFERIVINIDRYGNTTAGTIPLATRDALSAGRLKKGDLVLFRSGRRGIYGWGGSVALGVLRGRPAGETACPHRRLSARAAGGADGFVCLRRDWLMGNLIQRIVRHILCLGIVASIVGVYTRLIAVNATTAALTFLLAVLLIATIWGLAEALPPR